MPQWMIHLVDGTTLTDDHCYPHEIDSERITSVERIIRGRTLTIKKSPLIEDFFVASEASIDIALTAPGITAKPTEVTKKILGCYIKDTEPPIQCQFIMDPRSYNTILDFFEVHVKSKRGITARRITSEKKILRELHQRQFGNEVHGIIKSPLIKQVFQTPTGLSCVLVKPKIKAEVFIRGSNILLEFGQPGEKLSAN